MKRYASTEPTDDARTYGTAVMTVPSLLHLRCSLRTLARPLANPRVQGLGFRVLEHLKVDGARPMCALLAQQSTPENPKS